MSTTCLLRLLFTLHFDELGTQEWLCNLDILVSSSIWRKYTFEKNALKKDGDKIPRKPLLILHPTLPCIDLVILKPDNYTFHRQASFFNTKNCY